MRDNYGVSPHQDIDFGKPAEGTQQSSITPFATVMGLEGVAFQGPKGRYTMTMGKYPYDTWTVQEAATMNPVRKGIKDRIDAFTLAATRAGIEL